VNYHQNVPPGRNTADIEVFEATREIKDLIVATRLIAIQPNGDRLIVAEEFTIRNQSQPPVTVYREEKSFEFALPEGAELGQVSVTSPAGMPLVQGTVELGKGRYGVNYPFRPGENSVRLSYELAYPQNTTTLRTRSPYAARTTLLISPPSVTISGAGFSPRGVEQGWSVYSRDAVPADTMLELSISGTAPPPSEQKADASQPPAATNITVVPQRLDNLKWFIIAGFTALFALGAFSLWKRPVTPVASAQVKASANTSESVAQDAAQALMERVSQQAKQSLEEVKERLLRIEIRKQAGTISEEEYLRERSQAEAALRQLLS
jgi:hypothetical protein